MLWAHTAGIVSPENVVLTTSVDALLMAVSGGAGTLVGGVIGAFIVFGMREYLSTLVPWWQYALGAVYVLTILLSSERPDGHSGANSPTSRFAIGRRRRSSHSCPAEDATETPGRRT